MSKYASNYDWWLGEHKDMLSWVVDEEGKVTLGDIIEALRGKPGCLLAIVEPEFRLCVEIIRKDG